MVNKIINKFKEIKLDLTDNRTIEEIISNSKDKEVTEYRISLIEAGFAEGWVKNGKLVKLRFTPRGEEEFREKHDLLEELSPEERIAAEMYMIDYTRKEIYEIRREMIPIPLNQGYLLMECT